MRGYSGAFAAAPRDIIIANPNGSVSINTEPSQVGPDLSTAFYVDGAASDARFKAIFINNRTTAVVNKFSSFSAIGKEGNVSNPGLDTTVIEGFRAQFVNEAATSTFQRGTAVNLQVLRNPLAAPPPVIDATAASLGGELADLYWQDLGYVGPASTNPAQLPVGVAQSLDKFFISFRNGLNTGPFVAGNRLPVMTFQSNGRVGIGQVGGASPASFFGPAPIFLDVLGNGLFNGNFIASDRRFKDDIRPVEGAMDKVRRLRGSTYTMRTAEFPDKHFAPGRQYGFIAQEVEEVIPEIAQQCDNGFYAVNYDALIPVLTEAIKEQDKTATVQAETIKRLESELNELRSQFNDLKAGQQPGDLKGFRLDQNAPNPTGGNTVIGYALPTGTVGARITVYDLTGRTIKTWTLSDTEGQITVNAETLASGLYLYDLQVGGRQVLERKMSVVKL